MGPDPMSLEALIIESRLTCVVGIARPPSRIATPRRGRASIPGIRPPIPTCRPVLEVPDSKAADGFGP
jgi:hypothetical protein